MARGSDIRLRRVVLAFASGIATQWYCPYGQFLHLTPPLMTGQSYIKPFKRRNCPRVANPWLTVVLFACSEWYWLLPVVLLRSGIVLKDSFLRLIPPLMIGQSYIKPFQRWSCPAVANDRNCPPWLTVKCQKATQRWQHCVASDKGVQIRKWV